MRVLCFDPFSGAAGDMVTSALLECGADRDAVTRAMASVVAPPTYIVVERCGIRALQIETHAGPASRTFHEVCDIVSDTDAPDSVKEMAVRVFTRIRDAEEEIHGAHTHFHEVGADDAIADVVGACTAFHSLSPDAVRTTAVAVGTGTIKSAHGIYPLPAPATLAILRKGHLLIRYTNEERELCTPTGAALLAEFMAAGTHEITTDTVHVTAVGYGAGTRNPSHMPNVLRASVCEPEPENERETREADTIDILETNVDDTTAEVIAYTLGRLMDAGARDASAIPLIMKKGRPGTLIRVICSHALAGNLIRILSEELGTLGVRCIPSVHRSIITRTMEPVEIVVGSETVSIPVKTGWIGTEPVSCKAEFEIARQAAEAAKVPLRDVTRRAEEKRWKELRGEDR
ncbi:nickel pincer cofactor biosynthesis protein LarC [Methanogenium sp. S4BF]|uniref:nickel pincer cofactor biosynthesis protein LarC n=1 Tax=Methanogenium sp. S4BF TaxID=1789226 RepID=UPI002417235C|nr:nickel pincer cofactor biosynthesis protein LarC [Methanogenium sp. S4BF]WFN34682.1 nickel pincer cofactor biosynthesis protein LarC [Methanogenium sp. S4BF]